MSLDPQHKNPCNHKPFFCEKPIDEIFLIIMLNIIQPVGSFSCVNCCLLSWRCFGLIKYRWRIFTSQRLQFFNFWRIYYYSGFHSLKIIIRKKIQNCIESKDYEKSIRWSNFISLNNEELKSFFYWHKREWRLTKMKKYEGYREYIFVIKLL